MLKEQLAERRAKILGRWLELVLETYPPDTAEFLKREKDPFRNPVRGITEKELARLYDSLTEPQAEEAGTAIFEIVRLRAVQDFTPAAAVGFLQLLKDAASGELESAEWTELGRLVDRLLLAAFDAYMECRERIYSIRNKEVLTRHHRLFERLNKIYGVAETPEEQVSG